MNNPTRLRWGILGAARINERLLPAIVEADNAELVAIASRRPGAGAETLAKYAPKPTGAQCYDNLDALLKDDDVQAVYLPMANQEHAEWALRAIEHRKHVLCEKPMALTIADIDAIEIAARRYNVKVMEGFMYRFHPQHQRVLELINAGLIGEIRSVRASYSFMMRPARLYRLADDTAHGGGAMWDIGCYAIHSLRLFFRQAPLAVSAVSKYVESGADSVTSGIVNFGDGRYGHFDFSFERARRCEYEIIGTHGGIKCHVVWQLPGDVPAISWWTEDGRQAEERLPYSNHFRLEIEHFSDCVLNNRDPALSLDDARANCRIIVAALQAAAEGRTVKI
ncbi:oxidoreductase [Methylomonas sp. LWB]|uniref:Gfo/Idh/MocA family protein n=1 Tax=Methylomonas sp. LWB TaxID=1905845 RepID=UPI0008D9A2C0|nr:Gfo/Idh/MocA family oxidoreductase [Methylomonas sp. LWB]OHX36760.1 oxidoreductase [Methylomonas sp. LWB]